MLLTLSGTGSDSNTNDDDGRWFLLHIALPCKFKLQAPQFVTALFALEIVSASLLTNPDFRSTCLHACV